MAPESWVSNIVLSMQIGIRDCTHNAIYLSDSPPVWARHANIRHVYGLLHTELGTYIYWTEACGTRVCCPVCPPSRIRDPSRHDQPSFCKKRGRRWESRAMLLLLMCHGYLAGSISKSRSHRARLWGRAPAAVQPFRQSPGRVGKASFLSIILCPRPLPCPPHRFN